MKKTLVVAAALATMALSTTASALDVGFERVLAVEAFGGQAFATLGSLSFIPLGANGQYCDYLADWASPFNPNDVGLCVVHELRTAFAPSCILNETVDITTAVTAGAGVAGGGLCQGFNLKGELYDNVSLVLTEGYGGLQGIAVIPTGGVPQIYPIRTN